MIRLFIQNLMRGRYGQDELSRFMIICGLILNLLPIIFLLSTIGFYLQLLGFGLVALAVLRIFSRNIDYRRMEAQRYRYFKQALQKKFGRFKQLFGAKYWQDKKKYKIVSCPKCQAGLRLPRGKGKIVATCPRCKNKVPTKT